MTKFVPKLEIERRLTESWKGQRAHKVPRKKGRGDPNSEVRKS